MRAIFLAIAAFSTVALAQTATGPNPFKIPQGFSFTAGKPTDIQWNPTTPGTVTLRLREGANSDLSSGTVIGSHLPNNGAFTFTPPADTVRNSDYALEIVSDTDPTKVNYTPQFVIESSNTVASVTSSSSASASSTGSSSSTSASSTTSISSTTSASSTTSGSSSSTMSTSTTGSSSSTGSTSMTSGSSTSRTSSASASSTGSSSSSATASATGAPSNGAVVNSLNVGGALIAVVYGAVAAW